MAASRSCRNETDNFATRLTSQCREDGTDGIGDSGELDNLATGGTNYCPICQDVLDNPRLLPCVHSSCLRCLEEYCAVNNLLPGDDVPCPVCRTEFQIPKNGVAGLSVNTLGKNLPQQFKMWTGEIRYRHRLNSLLRETVVFKNTGTPKSPLPCRFHTRVPYRPIPYGALI